MIEQEKIKRVIKNINEWKYEGETPFTVLPPSYSEKYLLRVYAYGGLLLKIRYDYFTKKTHDIEMMDDNYCKYLNSEEERDNLKAYLEKAKSDSDYALELFDGDKNCEIDNQFMKLAIKAMKNKWSKKTGLPKEKDIQGDIVSNFIRNNSKWKVVAQEVQFERLWFSENNFTSGTTDAGRFDLVVTSDKGLGFVELKVNNENTDNLNSHYEHMQFIRRHPNKFVEEIDRRFEIIKKYALWQEEEFKKYNKKNLWFGFLFVNGGEEACKEIIERHLKDKDHNSDDTYYMYYEGDLENLDINGMMSYEEFMT